MEHPSDFIEPSYHGDYGLRVERFSQIIPELHKLHEAHWAETEGHRHSLGLNGQYQRAVEAERRGGLVQFTVRTDFIGGGELIGNLRFYLAQSAHTGTRVAEEDTFYIAPDHRNTGLGRALMEYAEAALQQLGVREIRANVKLEGRTAEFESAARGLKAAGLMMSAGYKPVAIQFHKIIEEMPNVQ